MSKSNLKLVENSASHQPVQHSQPSGIEFQPHTVSVKSDEFKALVKLLGSKRKALILRQLEFLNNEFGNPVDGFKQFICPPKDKPTAKSLLTFFKDIPRNALFEELKGIRVASNFEEGKQLDPATIDFHGMYYATYYCADHNCSRLTGRA